MTDAELRFVVRLALGTAPHQMRRDPIPGDLVVEVTRMHLDPDAIGWLIAHGEAPLYLDGRGHLREVWDIEPLSGRGPALGSWRPQRWENATFKALPEELADLAREAFPRKWDQDRMRPITPTRR